ncbi:hypothetical protein ScFU6_03670 [Streptococcus canis]|nr:hypothetical protein ScFU6_03670 [Streptococcus canis]
MKCNDKFKSNAVKMYRSGKWIEMPEGIGQKTTKKTNLSGLVLQLKENPIQKGFSLDRRNEISRQNLPFRRKSID